MDEIIETILSAENSEKTRQALDLENENLNLVINSLSDGVIITDKDGNFKLFNPVAKDILGIGLQEVNPSEWTSIYGCYYPDKVTPYPSEQLPLARAIKGEVTNDELLFIKNPERQNGVYITISACPLRDANGLINGGSVIFRDITENILTTKKLKESEERGKAQFKGFPIPTYVWRHVENEFILIDYNNAAEDITKGKIKESLDLKLDKMFEKSPYLKEILSDFKMSYQEKRTSMREMTYRLQSTGELKELIVFYVFVPPDLIMVHTQDITERKNAEEEIKKLSNAVEQTADSVVITNKKGFIEYVNPAFEQITGFSSDEALGQRPQILQSGKHDKTFYTKMWSTLLKGNPYRGTIINKKKNNELFYCEQTITPMKNKDGNITNFVSVLKDITELKEKQEQEFRLNIASEIQKRLNEPTISLPGYDIAGETYSAVETSGDFFDFLSLPDGQIGMVLGDVCGHGIGSALIMAETRAYVRAFAKTNSNPEVILDLLNKELATDLDGFHYVTLILARLDPQSKMFDYASAGHIPGYILNHSGNVEHVLASTGIPLGYIHDYEYTKSEPIKLNQEDILFFLSDGITEAQSNDEVEFGSESALDSIKNNHTKSAKNIVDQLYENILSFTNNQPIKDDITSIICKVKK